MADGDWRERHDLRAQSVLHSVAALNDSVAVVVIRLFCMNNNTDERGRGNRTGKGEGRKAALKSGNATPQMGSSIDHRGTNELCAYKKVARTPFLFTCRPSSSVAMLPSPPTSVPNCQGSRLHNLVRRKQDTRAFVFPLGSWRKLRQTVERTGNCSGKFIRASFLDTAKTDELLDGRPLQSSSRD